MKDKLELAFRDYLNKTVPKDRANPEYLAGVQSYMKEDVDGSIISLRYLGETYYAGEIVAISRGGLFPAFLMQSMGFPVTIADFRRNSPNRGCTFNGFYHDIDVSSFRGKKLLFLEEDVATGDTMREAALVFAQYSPRTISAYFFRQMISQRHYGDLPGNILPIDNLALDFKRTEWKKEENPSEWLLKKIARAKKRKQK